MTEIVASSGGPLRKAIGTGVAELRKVAGAKSSRRG